MVLTGYHGTTSDRADKILMQGFMQSRKDIEWLGFGVYFFADVNWAIKWAGMQCTRHRQPVYPVVLAAELNCRDNGLFDLDIPENMQKLTDEFREAFHGNAKGSPNFTGSIDKVRSQIRCMACNFYKAKHQEVKVFSYTFPAWGFNSAGFPNNQKQYCVVDTTRIQNIRKMEGDYAI